MTFQEATSIMRGHLCPECGNTDRETIADNGDPHPWNRGYLCEVCEVQWDADKPAQDGDVDWSVFEDVFGVTVTEDRVLPRPRPRSERGSDPL